MPSICSDFSQRLIAADGGHRQYGQRIRIGKRHHQSQGVVMARIAIDDYMPHLLIPPDRRRLSQQRQQQPSQRHETSGPRY